MKSWQKIILSAAMMLGIGHCCRHYNTLNFSKLNILSRPTQSIGNDERTDILLDTLPRQNGAIVLNWQMLAKTKFKPLSVDSLDGIIVMMPTFPLFMRKIEGQIVQMKGFVIPLEETGDATTMIISANSYTSCFFCGQAGPESVMDIRLKNPELSKRYKQDEQVTFRGRLKLNETNFDYFNYILEEGEPVK
jgi:hypothetical protein